MKTKEVIRQLMEADPTGECEVCVGNVDIHFIDREPAYYDGSLQVLIRDPKSKYYNITGAKYVRSGDKIVIHTLSISDAISNSVDFNRVEDFQVDYSELSQNSREATQKAHEDLREWNRKLYKETDLISFIAWAKEKAEKLTADVEDIHDLARNFAESNSIFDPLTSEETTGFSYLEARKNRWDREFVVRMDEGFLRIDRQGEEKA